MMAGTSRQAKGQKNRKQCPEGHVFYKSSDCPVCPVCEQKRKPASEWMNGLSAPARRALENKGLTSLKKLAGYTEKQLTGLHGIGPASLPVLKRALAKAGLDFKQNQQS